MKRVLFLVSAGAASAIALAACRPSAPPPLASPAVSKPVLVSDASLTYGQSEPYAIADSHGNVVVGWIDWTPPHPRIRVTRSTNGGISFAASHPIFADDAAHGDGQADVNLARTADGTIWASWLGCRRDTAAPKDSACDVYGASSKDNAATWSKPFAIAEGGPRHSERDWLGADGNRLYAAWIENLQTGSDWVIAERTSAGTFAVRSRIEKHAALSPIEVTAGRIETLAGQRGPTKDAGKVVLDRVRSTDGGATWTTLGTVAFDRAAVLLPYSMGHLAVANDGSAWIAIPRGDGTANDFVLAYRPAGLDVFRTASSLRASPGARVGLPWVGFFGDGEALVAWLEEHEDGWRVMTRRLRDAQNRSAAVSVTEAPFHFEEASLTSNVGDYLSVAVAGNKAWLVWSDTTGGHAEIHAASVTR